MWEKKPSVYPTFKNIFAEKPILPPVAETLEYEDSQQRNINGWIFAFSFQGLAPLNKENTMDLGSCTGWYFFSPSPSCSCGFDQQVRTTRIRVRRDKIYIICSTSVESSPFPKSRNDVLQCHYIWIRQKCPHPTTSGSATLFRWSLYFPFFKYFV